jgi:hypothetical protein
MIRHPLAGNLLAFFHYILGLHRLGHEVIYLEESGWSYSCYDPVTQALAEYPHTGLQLVRSLMTNYNLKVPVCYVDRDSGKVDGADWDDLRRMLKTADLLLNIGGVCWLSEFLVCHRRALIDMDPFFTQVGKFGAEGLDEYHVYFSYGSNIGRPGCKIPNDGIEWLPIVPPVVPEIWQGSKPLGVKLNPDEQRLTTKDENLSSQLPTPNSPLPILKTQEVDTHNRAFTTIANWSAYGSLTYHGEHYGQKDEEFLRLLDLPGYTSQRLELAVSGASPEVVERLRTAGWSVCNGGDVSADLSTYQAYILGSRGEFSAAKHGYVKTHSGWFSDRSVCYLAAGLPIIVQDTGFSDWLPTGQGVLVFSSLEEAAECIEQVNADYPAHCRAAREITTQTFSYKVVLPRLLKAIGKLQS